MTAPPRLVAGLRGLARSRLTHFAVLGAVLFGLAPAPAPGRERIHLSRARLDALATQAAAQAAGPVTSTVRDQIERRAVEDEVLVREALRLGLDHGDDIIRSRLVQKMLFVAEDLAGIDRAPTDAELAAFWAAHADAYQAPAQVEFVHVVADDVATATTLAPQVAAWSAAHPDGDVPPFGRGFPVARHATLTDDQLRRGWGRAFADALAAVPVGAWSAPIASLHGVHLVRVVARTAAHPASLDQVRPQVARELRLARRRAAIAAFVEDAARRYVITVDGAPAPALVATGRVAPRTAPSVED
ncbi:MAG: peptidylprolyl isomerase [Kofleriaceae bacterium]